MTLVYGLAFVTVDVVAECTSKKVWSHDEDRTLGKKLTQSAEGMSMWVKTQK
jgi:hypothetical protein